MYSHSQKVKRRMNRGPDAVDIYVGTRLRLRRTLLGFSQERLADSLGVTFQQVQKYENGTNRMSASRLFTVCKVLGVPVSYFFEGYEDKGVGLVAESREDVGNYLKSKEALDLLRAYYAIEDVSVRKKVLDMVKSLGKAS